MASSSNHWVDSYLDALVAHVGPLANASAEDEARPPARRIRAGADFFSPAD